MMLIRLQTKSRIAFYAPNSKSHVFLIGLTEQMIYVLNDRRVSNFLFVNEHQELQLDGFVTHEIQFEDINKAFDLLIEGQSLRCVIWMDK
jgi:hypothetical protein